MKVLIVFNHPAPYKVNTFNDLSKLVDLTVIFERSKEGNRPDEFYNVQEMNFKNIILKNKYMGNEGSYTSFVKKYIKKHHQEFDLILMNGYSHLAEIKAINFMHRKHIKFGLLVNGGIIKNDNCLKRKFKSSIISKANYYISPNNVTDNYLKHYGAKNKIYRYVYSNIYEKNIIDAPIKDKSELRKQFDLPLDKRIFINSAQFIERKNNFELITIFEKRNDYLLLVGDGVEKEKYLEYIKNKNIENVFILPFMSKDELFNLMKACDGYITLSKEDIFGHTTIEAMSNGLPVISSNKVVSSIEYIENGNNGYIVSIDDINGINKALDNCDYNKMSKNAIKTAKEITFEKTVSTLNNVLGEIYGEK